MKQVHCNACGTAFQCQDSSTGWAVPCPNCASQVAVPASAPVAVPTSTAPTATPVGSAAPMARPAAATAPQPLAGQAPAALPAAQQAPLPPHLAGGASPTFSSAPAAPSPDLAAMATAAGQAEMPGEQADASGGRWRSVIATAVWILMFAAVAGSGYAVYCLFPNLFAKDHFQSITADEEESDLPPTAKTAPWTDASKKNLVQRLHGVKVRVTRVEFGEVLAKDATGTVQSSEGSLFLQVFVKVENGTDHEVNYQSWYGNMFTYRGKKTVATLFDSDNRKYQMMTFGDVIMVKGHVPEAVLKTSNMGWDRKFVEDVLIFDVPADVVPEQVDYFRLELPAAAIGLSGRYRFQIPGSMINQPVQGPALGQPGAAADP